MGEKIAEVVLHTGRLWLRVRGYFIIMEGTKCYDPDIKALRTINGEDVWHKESLQQMADIINDASNS